MKTLVGVVVFVSSTLASGQLSKIDVYRADAMKVEASRDGKPAVKQGVLEQYPNHLTMFIVRKANGQAEVHQHTADVFVVTDGTATLMTGGTVGEGKTTELGEIRGARLIGAAEVTLHQGDIVHIPANLPHQLLIPQGGSFAYFVVKVHEASDTAPR